MFSLCDLDTAQFDWVIETLKLNLHTLDQKVKF